MSFNPLSNIVLIGFMASGKSRVGEMLKERLGYELFDLDRLVERDEGLSIKEMVEQKGEGYFREQEARTLKNLSKTQRSIIVTGGGTATFFDNAQALKRLGQIFFLDASLFLILKRLKHSSHRPLGKIASREDQERIEELYHFRRPLYLGLGTVIDVTHENKSQTCDEIIERHHAHQRLEKIIKTRVHDASSSYQIFNHDNALKSLADIILAVGLKEHRPVIITSTKLAQIFHHQIEELKRSLNSNLAVITFADGEEHKNQASVNDIHQQMFDVGLKRQSLVIALGGGNVGDVAGFAASIYLRGLPFIQVPSTLLSMVDASIGGKTGIDTVYGKNLLGSFYNPKAVIIDPQLLETLPKEDFAAGMAEVIKHAIIGDRELFYLLKDHKLDLSSMIKRALWVKAQIVSDDPKEKHIRSHLNLGHTFAHAIEKVSDYRIKHGIAVAMGLVLAVELSQKLGIVEEDFLPELLEVLQKYHLPTSLPAEIRKADLIAAMKHDKKSDNKGLKFILVKRIGEVTSQYVEIDDIL